MIDQELRLLDIEIKEIGLGLVTHNYPCPIWFTSEKAVYTNPDGHFLPSWRAQKEGWVLIKADKKWKKFLVWLMKEQA
jgi:hypothetical protein